jgi:hypothetical protein
MITGALRKGSQGTLVKKIQYFLIGRGFGGIIADGDFGPNTELAIEGYQITNHLEPDGVVGNKTLLKMLNQGLLLLSHENSLDPPSKPPFPALQDRPKIFGKFNFKSKPEKGNPENIEILGDWEEKNIVSVVVPHLNKFVREVRIHKLFEYQFLRFWRELEKANLLPLIKSFDGAFVPRFIRGSRTTLSNHSYGSAFDINYEFNQLGARPAEYGSLWSVRELVPIAHKLGMYWGGHFSRLDGMHFELAVLLKEGEWLDINYETNTYSKEFRVS